MIDDVFEWAKQFSPVCVEHVFKHLECQVCGQNEDEWIRKQVALAELERKRKITPVRLAPGERSRRRILLDGVSYMDVCDFCGEECDYKEDHLCYADELQRAK